MNKIRLLLLCGGQSEEHEVSLSSAKSVLEALDKDRFEVTPVVITREGKWLPASETPDALARGSAPSGGQLVLTQAGSAAGYDVVFPLLHGPMGEDGTIQGLLRLAGIPFVGSSVLSSSVCMDKIMMKSVLATHNIPQVAYQAVSQHQYSTQPEQVLARLEQLQFPMFVKPANLGSSVGISKARNAEELRVALHFAFGFDRRVIIEQSASHKPRELEVAILGNDTPKASPVGELTFTAEFYDYETKYTDGRAAMHIPAHIPAEIAAKVQQLALESYQILDCAGLARIDFFYVSETGELFLNELNTIPGFTKTSMYPKLWEAGGIGYANLVSKLIELALERR